MLGFYDHLRRQSQSGQRFEQLIEEALGDARADRGAERMLRQTRFLARTFREYEQRLSATGACDEHMLRERLITEPARDPVRHVVVTVAEGAPPDTTVQSVKDALRRVLWPLADGGFDRQGWPLGRALSNRELAVEVARVQGVSEVGGLNLFSRSPSSGDWEPIGDSRTGREQNLPLERWQLPELLAVVVVATTAMAPAVSAGAANRPGSKRCRCRAHRPSLLSITQSRASGCSPTRGLDRLAGGQ